MSQAGIVDIIGTHPEIPILFVCNVGSAVPIANTLEILGSAVAAHSIPLETVGSGNTVQIEVQYTSSGASSVANKAGVASFDSASFAVDANGYVTLNGGAFVESFTVDAASAPGTNPVVPNGSGNVTVTGGQVAAGTTTNVIRTDSLAANSYTIQIQRSQAVGSSTVGDNGVCHFSSSDFTVDSNGFVQNALGNGRFPVTPYVVGPVGKAGYQTIQSAVNAANSAGGGIVVVQPGTYVENLTLYNACHIMGLTFADAGGGVTIQGVHTPPISGGFAFNNVQLESSTHIFNSSGAGSAHLIIANAAIIVTNGYTFNLPNWTGKLETYDVNDRGSTNDGYVNNTGGSEIAIFSAAVGAGTANTMIVSGVCSIFTCSVGCPINFVTGSDAFMEYNVHVGAITLSNNSTGEFIGCEIDTSITMSSSAAWTIAGCIINTSSNPAIAGSGAGTLTLSNLSFLNNSSISGSLTLANSSFYPVAMTNGQLLIGHTGSVASASTLTAGSGISITNGAGSITVSAASGVATTYTEDSGTASPSSNNLNVLGSGSITTSGSGSTITTALTGLTNHNVLVGAGTSTITKVPPSTAGFVLTSNGASADPSFQDISASGAIKTITGNSGGAESPTAGGNFNILGTGSITVAGSANTETVQLTGLTNHNVQVGAGTATLTQVAPSATAGIPLVSNGSSADPSFTTAVVAGGGTGNTTFTAYSVICAGTTATGAFQNVSGVGTSGQVLTSNGASALPTWQSAASGAWVLIQTQTTASSSALTFTTGITGYSKYVLIGTNVFQAATATMVEMQISTDGGATYKTTNYISGANAAAWNSNTITNTNITSAMIMHLITAATGCFQALLDFTASTMPNCSVTGGSANTQFSIVGAYLTSSTVNAFKLLPDAGTFGGTFSLYGIAQ